MAKTIRKLNARLLAQLFIALFALLSSLTTGIGTGYAAASAARVDVLVSFTDTPRDDVELAGIKNLGGKVKHGFRLIPAAAVSVPESKLDALRAMPGVRSVSPDVRVQTQGDAIPWGIAEIGATVVQGQQQNGQGVKVAIIDTGIDLSHPDLRVAGGVAFTWYTTSWNDDNGHGTHVAGIVAGLSNGYGVVGVAPGVDLYAIKALDYNAGGAVSDVIAGLQWAVDNKMDVVNMSLSATIDVPEFRQAVDNAYKAGVVLVAAAGNLGYVSGQDTVTYPARYSSVIAVGATDVAGNRASWSSVGGEMELAAPGVDIFSTVPEGYAYMSGTSMGAPHVTGAVALLMGAGMKDIEEIRSRLNSTARDLGDAGVDSYYGWGEVDVLNAMTQLNQAKAVDVTAPLVSAYATPNQLYNRMGKMVAVTIGGSAKDETGGAGIHSVAITVKDEYGTVEPVVTRFGDTVLLENISRNKSVDPDGRTYIITVTATDVAGNATSATATVVVSGGR